jgi:lysine-N-methylase
MKLLVLQGENFTCHSCTNCCRDWHVELTDDEARRIAQLKWPAGDPLQGASVLMKHAGKTYLSHRGDASCVFLNLDNGRCRIHEQFGPERKPLGCRLFPFQFRTTFIGEASVTARYDCPSVRRNAGLSHADALPELHRLARELQLDSGFDELTRCHLDRDQIQAVVEFISTMLGGFERDEEKAIFLWLMGEWLTGMDPAALSRQMLAQAFAELKQLVTAAVEAPLRRPGLLQRHAFRSLLGQYLRRDEDVLNGRVTRARRAIAMTRFVSGFGSFRGLGLSHPPGGLRRAKLFKSAAAAHDPSTFALFWRMVRGKLESLQFMGSGNYGRSFIDGLRSLSLLYPLVRAVAKFSSASRGAPQIEPVDVDYAVAAIEHSFGRQPILSSRHMRSLEKLLLDQKTFMHLVRGV